jgi:hypothetical protein
VQKATITGHRPIRIEQQPPWTLPDMDAVSCVTVYSTRHGQSCCCVHARVAPDMRVPASHAPAGCAPVARPPATKAAPSLRSGQPPLPLGGGRGGRVRRASATQSPRRQAAGRHERHVACYCARDLEHEMRRGGELLVGGRGGHARVVVQDELEAPLLELRGHASALPRRVPPVSGHDVVSSE